MEKSDWAAPFIYIKSLAIGGLTGIGSHVITIHTVGQISVRIWTNVKLEYTRSTSFCTLFTLCRPQCCQNLTGVILHERRAENNYYSNPRTRTAPSAFATRPFTHFPSECSFASSIRRCKLCPCFARLASWPRCKPIRTDFA